MINILKKLLLIVWTICADLFIMVAVFTLAANFTTILLPEADIFSFIVGMFFAVLAFGHLKFRHKLEVLKHIRFNRSFSGVYGIWLTTKQWAIDTEISNDPIIGSKTEMQHLVMEWQNELTAQQRKQVKYEVKSYSLRDI